MQPFQDIFSILVLSACLNHGQPYLSHFVLESHNCYTAKQLRALTLKFINRARLSAWAVKEAILSG